MKKVTILVVGFGHVGQAFINLVAEKSLWLKQKYGLTFYLRAILRQKTAFLAHDPCGLLLDSDILNQLQDQARWSSRPEIDSLLKPPPPGVLVEATPTNLQTGEPGLTHVSQALARGWHAVTANKGPLVKNMKYLLSLAKEKKVQLKCSGATAAALPALDVGLRCLAGTEVQEVAGILNGTSNFILGRMEEGMTFAEALEEAQRRGIAERDPRYDVEGWDTAVKLIILANAILGYEVKLEQVEREGIEGITKEQVTAARQRGEKIKLLGKIYWEKGNLRVRVKPETLPANHPLYSVDGTNKGISFTTDSMGTITVTGGKSDPRGAAAALLKDIINIYSF